MVAGCEERASWYSPDRTQKMSFGTPHDFDGRPRRPQLRIPLHASSGIWRRMGIRTDFVPLVERIRWGGVRLIVFASLQKR